MHRADFGACEIPAVAGWARALGAQTSARLIPASPTIVIVIVVIIIVVVVIVIVIVIVVVIVIVLVVISVIVILRLACSQICCMDPSVTQSHMAHVTKQPAVTRAAAAQHVTATNRWSTALRQCERTRRGPCEGSALGRARSGV